MRKPTPAPAPGPATATSAPVVQVHPAPPQVGADVPAAVSLPARSSRGGGQPAEPLVVSAPEAASMCGLHVNTWHRWMREGLAPAPCRQIKRADGRVIKSLFAVRDLSAWVAMGMPERSEFEARRRREARAT